MASSAFDVLAGTTSSSVDLVYYDRFSPINLKTQSRVLMEMTATLKVLGGGASWKGLSYGGDRLEVYYDSGVLEEDGVEVRRTGRFGGGGRGRHRPGLFRARLIECREVCVQI